MPDTHTQAAGNQSPADIVLVVEDSAAILDLIAANIEEITEARVIKAKSLAEARVLLDRWRDRITLAVLDLNLGDAPDGEIVAVVRARHIPVIVLTGTMSEAMRERVMRMNVVDYVYKRNANEISYVASLARRILANRGQKVLVVDDTASFRGYLAHLLKVHRYRVIEADGAVAALDILKEHPEIRLVITDYNMPDMDGMELVCRIREQRDRTRLAIIGVSGDTDASLTPRMLKAGANDFLHKPFQAEEFYCRITQNMDTLDYVRAIRDAAQTDFMTGLHNRNYLFEHAERLFNNAQRGHIELSVAMLDIDHFKRINDSRGHAAGDSALKVVAQALKDEVRDGDLLARVGGEEFCVVGVNVGDADAMFERYRRAVENATVSTPEGEFHTTISIGVCQQLQESFDAMLATADAALYVAKHAGRNRYVIADLETPESEVQPAA